MRQGTVLTLTAALAILSGCAAGPDYSRPAALADASVVAFSDSSAWKTAEPGQADILSDWWTVYQDSLLNQLIAQAMQANQSLAQTQAVYEQALALVPAAQAANSATLAATAGVNRAEGYSQGVSSVTTNHNWALQAAWEPDFWGHVKRSVELAGANAQASAADLANARLVVQATLVNDYLQLRLIDRQLDLYDALIDGYRKSLRIVEAQLRGGVAGPSDVELARATLTAAQAQAEDLQLTREQLTHAVAVLIGKLPAQFSIARLPKDAALPTVPAIPAVIPSQLLERRPDIAAAERRVAAANANIGVVRSAWFPNLTLAASYGNAGPTFDNWLNTPFEAWAVGATLAASLWDGGLRNAQDTQAKAAFDAAAAGYRQTVLAGFQDVEDNLSAMTQLQREVAYQKAAADSSLAAERVTLRQYQAGTVPYTSVVTVQSTALNNQRTVVQLQSRQLLASVALIKSIGGGWHAQGDGSATATPSQ